MHCLYICFQVSIQCILTQSHSLTAHRLLVTESTYKVDTSEGCCSMRCHDHGISPGGVTQDPDAWRRGLNHSEGLIKGFGGGNSTLLQCGGVLCPRPILYFPIWGHLCGHHPYFIRPWNVGRPTEVNGALDSIMKSRAIIIMKCIQSDCGKMGSVAP